MADPVRAHVWVSGQVQGVFFRASCQQAGRSLGLAGWVRNLDDGRVEAVAEGDRDKVEQFIGWCHKGPPRAHVTNVEVKWEKPAAEKGFRITF